jgi:hypothetical protein
MINQILLLMGLLTKIRNKRLIKSIGNGIIDAIPVLGTVKNNVQSELPQQGKFDYIRLATSIILIMLFAAFLLGKISLADLKELVKIID